MILKKLKSLIIVGTRNLSKKGLSKRENGKWCTHYLYLSQSGNWQVFTRFTHRNGWKLDQGRRKCRVQCHVMVTDLVKKRRGHQLDNQC